MAIISADYSYSNSEALERTIFEFGDTFITNIPPVPVILDSQVTGVSTTLSGVESKYRVWFNNKWNVVR